MRCWNASHLSVERIPGSGRCLCLCLCLLRRLNILQDGVFALVAVTAATADTAATAARHPTHGFGISGDFFQYRDGFDIIQSLESHKNIQIFFHIIEFSKVIDYNQNSLILSNNNKSYHSSPRLINTMPGNSRPIRCQKNTSSKC